MGGRRQQQKSWIVTLRRLESPHEYRVHVAADTIIGAAQQAEDFAANNLSTVISIMVLE